jgi:hypothetical protein
MNDDWKEISLLFHLAILDGVLPDKTSPHYDIVMRMVDNLRNPPTNIQTIHSTIGTFNINKN